MPDGRWVCANCGIIFDLHEGTEYQIHLTKCNDKKNIQKEKLKQITKQGMNENEKI